MLVKSITTSFAEVYYEELKSASISIHTKRLSNICQIVCEISHPKKCLAASFGFLSARFGLFVWIFKYLFSLLIEMRDLIRPIASFLIVYLRWSVFPHHLNVVYMPQFWVRMIMALYSQHSTRLYAVIVVVKPCFILKKSVFNIALRRIFSLCYILIDFPPICCVLI